MFNIQIFIDGLTAAAGLALLAVAFQTVYLPTRVFFLGLAGIYVACPFLVYECLGHGWGWPLSIGTAVLASVGFSESCELLNHSKLAQKNAPAEAHLISSLGIYLVVLQLVTIVWGSDTKVFPSSSVPSTNWAGLTITNAQWIECITAIAVLSLWGLGLKYSQVGLRLRALSDNPTQFVILGMNERSYRLVAFGAAGFLAAASSIITGYDIGFDPHDGLHRVLLAVVAVVIGGRHTFLGPIVGSLILCIVREQVAWYLSARWQETATFIVLAIFVLFRPHGILGQKTRLEFS